MTVVEFLKDFLFEGDLQERYLIKYSAIPLSTIAFYIVFVKWLGPAVMADRKPFDLKYTMVIYNFFQCFANAYIEYQMIQFDVRFWYGRCKAKQHPELPLAIAAGKRIAWLLFLIKYIDLIDTVFFVLRKKDNQATFLHLFHHTAVCLFGWWFARSLTSIGYYLCLAITINTGVHVVMYFYYGLAAIGPSMRKYLWWKRYLTQLQITQFLVVMLYMLHGFVTGCEELGPNEIISFLFILILFVLFLDFYKKDRERRRRKKELKYAINELHIKET